MATDKLPAIGFFEKHRAKIAFAGPDECWLWTASHGRKGYGRVKARGKARGAHRIAYESACGEGSADGLVVRHKCDNPPCVNPAHLELGTHADNARDRSERGRHVRGSFHKNAKLTDADVVKIRSLYIPHTRDHGLVAIARRFEVTTTLVSKIIRRERWCHV